MKSSLRLSDNSFALVFTLVYALLLAYLLPFHELWVDETEPWLLALYSDSYSDLLYNKRFEGHPNLWYSLLFVITRFTDNLQALKITHFFFSVGFVFVFLRHAPFHRIIRLLFCFGYYGLFEYGMISRLYAPELFTLFMICAFYPKRFSHWYLYILLLVLNAQTHLFGLYFSGIMGLFLFSEKFRLWDNIPYHQNISSRKLVFGISLWILGCGFSFWSITHTLGFAHPHLWDPYKFQQACTRIWQAFFPVPEFTFDFWNTSFLRTKYEIPLSLLLSVLIFVLFKPKKLFAALTLLFIALFYFFAFRFELSLRHHAHFFLFTVALFWVATHYIPFTSSLNLKSGPSFNWQTRALHYLLLGATFTQFLAGLYAVSMDYKHSFYPGKESASFLQKYYPNYFLATTQEFTSSTTGAYLGKPIYNLYRGGYTTFYELDPSIDNKLTPYQHLQWARTLAQETQKSIILISARKIAIEHFPFRVKHLKSFDRNQIVALPQSLSIYLYQVDPQPLPTSYFVAGTPVELASTVHLP
ncbi:hypothetical protein ACFSC6_16080 [Rufibacter sediminis]|uniref:Glycosyltransferase RgtA/B/C/D-like domain-containing protein n=1 Tax=Rufibacter sediminis TaxID=2762756 RepID=A0ABR6VMV6_9BACT|nr:hypothetical protein [Rufibacter sediminis]MBC3538495.1 hypothetical protein [Rufibacter sediminis]